MENPVKEDVQFQVAIILNEKLNRIMFNSKEEKDVFLLSEYKFCLNEIEKHGSAFDRIERKQLKNDLEIKRLAHVKHCGFSQVANTGIWNRTINKDALIVA